MPTTKPQTTGVAKDADALEDKFGEFADVYAETRREAAEMAGRETDTKHWEKVAATVEEPDEQ